MKKIIVLIALMVMTVAQAQDGRKGERRDRMKDATPQEIATLQSKKMTLDLDLTDKQEKEVYQVLLTQAEKRKANKMSREDRDKLTDEQKKTARIAAMDDRITVKRAMKKTLNEEQYAEWEKTTQNREGKRGKGDKKEKNRN